MSERLTERIVGYEPFGWGGGVFWGDESTWGNCPPVFCKNARKCEPIKDRTCPLLRALDRLADIEDILYDESGKELISLEELKEIAAARLEGRLTIRPKPKPRKIPKDSTRTTT